MSVKRWFHDADGWPRLERVSLAVGSTFAAIGWPLAIWVDPGAITMAVAASIFVTGAVVAMACVAAHGWCKRRREAK